MRIILALLLIISCSPLKRFEETASKWENDIAKLERLDKSQDYSEDSILFIGSSSIRLWSSIKDDLNPYETIRRAYGGARYTDLIHFTKRLVSSHDIKAVGVFVANDITGGINDLTPPEVLNLAKFVVKQIRSSHLDTPIFFIETTPTPKRWKAWPEISNANDLIMRYCNEKKGLFYISTRDYFIDKNGLPKEDLFIKDKLHLNRNGYSVWGGIIKNNLNRILALN
tara:strand:- start:59 stop:736 length:678 start_codon:yes stop_codon:yes gene_type:complete